MDVLISVCVPVYNDCSTIENAIQSVLNQTYQNFEIIVIDNKSTDTTYKLIKKIQDPRIRVYQNEENIGWRLNSNKALSSAKGEYVVTLHGDDCFNNKYLEITNQIFQENSSIGIIHFISKEEKKKYFNNDSIVKGEEYYSIICSLSYMPAPTATAYRNEALLRTKYYSKNYWTSEARLSMEIALQGYDTYIYDEILSTRYAGDDKDSNSIGNRILLFDQSLDFYHEFKNDKKILKKHKNKLKIEIFYRFIALIKLKIKHKNNKGINNYSLKKAFIDLYNEQIIFSAILNLLFYKIKFLYKKCINRLKKI